MHVLDKARIALRTERLALRPMREDDAERLFAQFTDWDVVHWLATPPWPYTLDDARAFLRARTAPDHPDARWIFAIEQANALIGGIDLVGSAAGRPTLGYWLGKAFWGRGYMTEAARGFIAHGFASGSGDTIHCGALAENEASLRVQEKLGFVRAGSSLRYARPRNGEFPHVDTLLTRARFATLLP